MKRLVALALSAAPDGMSRPRRYRARAFRAISPGALALSVLAPIVSGPAHAQQSPFDPRTLHATQPMTPAQPMIPTQSMTPAQPLTPAQPPDVPAAEAAPRTITLQAGTGMLLRLPQPAATIMSAEPAIARVQPASPTSLFLMGVTQGRTTVIATAEDGTPIGQFDVLVTPGLGTAATAAGNGRAARGLGPGSSREVQIAVHSAVPGARGVVADVVGGRLLLRGAVPTSLAAEQVEAIAHGIVGDETTVIDQMLVLGSVQVNVRVRIAEIDRTITRQLGFNWQALGSGGKWQFGLMTGAAAVANSTISGVTGGGLSVSSLPYSVLSPSIPLGLPSFQGAATPNQIGAGFSSGKWDINSVIDALAADQLVTILAEPNLTAQSGETASFLAGGEFPVPVAGSTTGGTSTITVDFKQFGVSLALVPTVLSPTRLNLRIRPEVSELSTAGAVSVPIAGGTLTIPALTVRRAETTVELGSGQSFAIAGLLQRTTTDVTNALPGIGEVPVIGALFKSNNFQRGESELVIIVTPYLVKPVDSPEDMHAPTDGFHPGNDADRMLLGRQMAPQPARPPLDAGFILK